MFVFSVSCRYPSSPWEAGGPGGQQHGSDDTLATSSFIRSLCCQQLRCGVQTRRCVCEQLDGIRRWCLLVCKETKLFLLSPPSDSLLWQQVATSREECVQIDALIPGGHYQFRVRASNRWGVGPPSEPSNMVTLPSSSKSAHTHGSSKN